MLTWTGLLAATALAVMTTISPTLSAAAPAGRACTDSLAGLLRPYAGSWKVEVVFLRPDGGAEVEPGQAVIESDLAGCVLVEHLRTRRDSLPFEVLAVWGAQGGSAPFQRVMAHSQHGVLGLYEGRRVGDTLLLDYAGVLPDPSARLRHVLRLLGRDRFTFESQRADRSDTTWRVTWRADYHRRHTDGGKP